MPESEIKDIPEAQLRDTAVIDLINNVQLEATGLILQQQPYSNLNLI